MPSSTSSSDQRLPAGPWGATWALALLVVAGSLVAIEGYWRWSGHAPSTVDDKDLWCVSREALARAGGRAIVFLGNSRTQLGIDTRAVADEAKGYRVFQLAIDGSYPIAALRDLAEDDAFSGVVVCDFWPAILVEENLESQADYVRYYRNEWNLTKKVDRTLRTGAQELMVLVSPHLNPINVARSVLGGRPIEPMYVRTYPDRSRAADYSSTDLEARRRGTADKMRELYERWGVIGPEEWRIAPVREMVRRIEARGGRVVFLRYPTTGEVKALDERFYPREAFVDVFARDITATTHAVVIHFEDVPEMARLDCPDGSHLDRRDSADFSRALVRELARRGVLGPPEAAPRPATVAGRSNG